MTSAAPEALSKAPHISMRAFQVRAIAAVSERRDLQRQAVSWFEISLRDGLTVVALQERSATTIVLLQAFDLWFHSETDRTERNAQFRRAETENTVWFGALAKEQLALVADGMPHGITFHLGVVVENLFHLRNHRGGLPRRARRLWIRIAMNT